MVTLLLGSALVIGLGFGLGAVAESTPLWSKGWASEKERLAFEREREKWRNAMLVGRL